MFRALDYLRVLLLLVTGLLAACQGATEMAPEQARQQILLTFAQGEAHETGLLNAFGQGYHRGDYGASLSTRQHIAGVARDYPIREQAGWVIGSLGVYCGLFSVAPGTDVDQLLRQLEADGRVESSQLLYNYSTRGGEDYNDPYFKLQYGQATPFILGLHRHSTGKGINVAVIDTGVDTHHPDLAEQVVETQVFLAVREPHAGRDIHGTAVAGIIAARANNGSGIVGIAPDARIHALQACRQLDSNSGLARCDSFTLARALSFAIDRRLEIINLSLSGPYDPLLARLVDAALEQGQVVTAADPGAGRERYPALLPGVIAVREETGLPESSEASGGALVVHAPKGEILSTGPGGGYDFYSGSSVATAIVSGLTALLLQQDATMSAAHRVAWLNDAMRRDISAAAAGVPQPLAGVAGGEEAAASTLLEF